MEMAFINRVLGLISRGSKTNAPTINTIRSMSSSAKLFVGSLSYGTDEGTLRDAFSGYGKVVEAKVITDRDSGRSRGFGFVSFSDAESASSAAAAMDGKALDGRSIRVSIADADLHREPVEAMAELLAAMNKESHNNAMNLFQQ